MNLNINMKLVNENIGDILKPKKEDDIINDLSNKSIKQIVSSSSKSDIIWKSLLNKGVSIEELFRIAYEMKRGDGIDFAIKNGAKGEFLSDKELIENYLDQNSKLLPDFIINRIPADKIFNELNHEFRYSFNSDEQRNINYLTVLSKYLEKNSLPYEQLFKILDNSKSTEILDFLINKDLIDPVELYDELGDIKPHWGYDRKVQMNPLKRFMLKKYGDRFDLDFVIKQAVKYKLPEIVQDNKESLNDFYNDEQILRIALNPRLKFDSSFKDKAIDNVDLSKIKPFYELYEYLSDIRKYSDIETLLKNKKNTPALLLKIKKISNISNLLNKYTGGAALSPNSRQGAPVKEAIKNHDVELVKKYLDHPKISDNTLQGSFWAACTFGNKPIIKLFLNNPKINPAKHFPEALLRAADRGNVETLKELINDSRIKNEGPVRYSSR